MFCGRTLALNVSEKELFHIFFVKKWQFGKQFFLSQQGHEKKKRLDFTKYHKISFVSE